MKMYERGGALGRESFRRVTELELERLNSTELELREEFGRKRDGDARARWHSAMLDLALATNNKQIVVGLRALSRQAYEHGGDFGRFKGRFGGLKNG